MLSYREKQLIAVQKMLQDNSQYLLNQIHTDDGHPPKNLMFMDVSSYEELVDLAEINGYDTYLRVEDLLSAEELNDIERRKLEIDNTFKKQTGIFNIIDLSFLALATALQCIRQYVYTPFHERTDDQAAAK